MRYRLFALCMLICIVPVAARAALTLTGFADVQYKLEHYKTASTALGQFELDLNAGLGNGTSFSGGILYDGEQFTSTTALLNLSLFSSKLFLLKLGFGQFDVPFGLSYTYIPSPVNRMIRLPLPYEQTMNAWNNVGAQVNGKISILEFTVFGVTGKMSSLTTATNEDDGMAVGGRAGLVLGSYFSAGASLAVNSRPANSTHYYYGLDATLNISFLSLAAETIMKSESGLFQDQDFGLFLEAGLDFSKLFRTRWGQPGNFPFLFTVRYGLFTPNSGDTLNRLSMAVAFRISKFFTFKLVHVINTESGTELDNDMSTFQVVASF